MFIKRSKKRANGVVYEYGSLVVSYNSFNGPRHRVLYSLGRMDSIPQDGDKELAIKLEKLISGQLSIFGIEDSTAAKLFTTMKPSKKSDVEKECPAPEIELERMSQLADAAMLPALIVENSDEASAVDAEIVDEEIVPIGTQLLKGPPVWMRAHTEAMEFKDAREAGSVWVGHKMWEMLGLGKILEEQNFSKDEIDLTEVLVLNRLIEPASEHATPEWVSRTALSDILGRDLDRLNYRKLYGNLDRLHPERESIEKRLFNVETNLFNLETSIYLYDLTSTYFEGNALQNEAAKHGYSRDSRPDCRQVVVGLMLNRDGFPIGHEIFDGNKVDSQTVSTILETLERRTDAQKGLTLTVDRGMSDKKNLELIREQGHHYIVAAKQTERQKWLAEFESEEGWQEVTRQSGAPTFEQVATGIRIKRFKKDDEYYVLCISEGRIAKDRAIREKQEKRLLKDLEKLGSRITKGELKTTKKIYESIGRIKERYPRVARYYGIEIDESGSLSWLEDTAKKKKAEQVDGSYILRTSRQDLTTDEIWRTYMLLTRVETAFRNLKGPLSMRPIFHQLQHRTESHIFVCVLAYHLLVSIERLLHQNGITDSWASVRKRLSTHQVVSGILRAKDGRAVEVRKDTLASPYQRSLYEALGIPTQIFSSSKVRWVNS